ncbi:flagellar hook-associated protein FlgK [Halomonas sp. NO4]|uniref:flagellar hook-associated protein FlgK n=1 Tax=Halomonas sp. NO4 TaxID=2484813 RepID=UPI0013D65C52|nr:flagellar hook-associated protein FlgK [Halomonas sp. NO4]
MSIFSTGLSGLNAAQNALNTTSNNISNVYTPGFNRESTILSEGKGDGGVRVNDIQRQFNQYVASQLNAATSASSALETYENQVSQIDNLLADRDAGLAPLVQNFFSSLEDLAGAPSDPASRQGVLGSADTLSAQFRAFDGYLQDMQEGINGQIKDEVTQINNTTQQLATLNREIALARARQGEAPNGLLNQRDRLVNELSERMDVRLNIQDGKAYNISLPNGQPLVSGTEHRPLLAMESPSDPQQMVLGYRDSGGNVQPLSEDTVTGGTLGGLMTFRAETLDKTQNQIGQMAVSMAVGFNEQHRLGQDLDGEQGEDFFAIGQPRAYSNERNAGSAEIDATAFDAANIGKLRATGYEIRVTQDNPTDATGFSIIRKDSGEQVSLDADAFDAATDTLSFGGMTLTFNDSTALQEGNRFEVQPVRQAAAEMETNIADLDKIAAGSLVATDGDMAVSGLGADAGALSGGEAYDITLNDAGQLTFSGATGFTQPTDILVNGETRTVDASGVVDGAPIAASDKLEVNGVRFTIDELPQAGETSGLEFGRNAAGSGDNTNALAMQDLQDAELVAGNASLSQAYGSMVSDVGNRTNIVKVNLDARQGLTDQLRAVQQSESGVNLDEEAANLIRFQQFYQANAKVIDTASTVFDTILGLRN